LSDLFHAAQFQITPKMSRINLFTGLYANTFTPVHSSFEKSMEKHPLTWIFLFCTKSCFNKIGNVAGSKIIKLQNQYLNKKVLFPS